MVPDLEGLNNDQKIDIMSFILSFNKNQFYKKIGY